MTAKHTKPRSQLKHPNSSISDIGTRRLGMSGNSIGNGNCAPGVIRVTSARSKLQACSDASLEVIDQRPAYLGYSAWGVRTPTFRTAPSQSPNSVMPTPATVNNVKARCFDRFLEETDCELRPMRRRECRLRYSAACKH